MKAYQSIALLAVLSLGVGCGGDDGGPGGKSPMTVSQDTTVWTYYSSLSNASIQSRKVGTVQAFGRDFDRWEAGSGSGADFKGVRADLNWKADRVEGVAVEVPKFAGIALPDGPILKAEATTPVVVDLDPPVGVPQQLALSGNVSLLGAAPTLVETTATYTLVSDDETVETPMGTLSGVKLFNGSGNALGRDLEGSVWYHPEYGIVAAEANFPEPNGLEGGLKGLFDPGDPDASTGVTQAVQAVGPGSPVFKLDTYDISGSFDADKNKHAKMLLEMRWLDETKAKDPSAQPGVYTEFGTVWGTYPHTVIGSPVSFLHPEENGKGYTFWIAYVDQAAKNESQNGIAYHIQVSGGDALPSPVQISARIIYERYQP